MSHVPIWMFRWHLKLTVTADLPDADTWQRMAVLYDEVAASAAHVAGSGGSALCCFRRPTGPPLSACGHLLR